MTTTFGKSLFSTQYRIRIAIYIPPNTKDLAINLTMSAYGNRPNAITFARANNSDLLKPAFTVSTKPLHPLKDHPDWTTQIGLFHYHLYMNVQ